MLFSMIWFTSGVHIGPVYYVPSLCTVFSRLNHGCRYWFLIPFVCCLAMSVALAMMIIYRSTGSAAVVATFGVAWIIFCIELVRIRPPNDIHESLDWIHRAMSWMIYTCIILSIALLTSPIIAGTIVFCQVILEIVRQTNPCAYSYTIGASQHIYLLMLIIAFIIKIEQGGFKKSIR